MRKIINLEKLAVTKTRRIALDAIEAGLEAIDTSAVTRSLVTVDGDNLRILDQQISLSGKNLFLCGVGKCALSACQTLEELLGTRIKGGIVMGVQPGRLSYTKYIQGTHPLPSETNVYGANELIEFLTKRIKDDVILLIVSGGGSALLACHKNLACTEESLMTHQLFQNGADIKELNTLRKHLSLARGGNLAAAAYPAAVVSLIFSDVPDNDLSMIASGPVVKDKTTRADALKIVEKYNLDRCCGVVKDCILETPKDDKYFAAVKNILLLTNRTALAAMQNKAQDHGWNALIRSENITGDVSDVLDEIIFDLREALPKTILLYGGETTMTGNFFGRGGRNQELVMRAVTHIDEGETVIAVASDGQDHGEVAGAIADALTAQKAKDKELDMRSLLKSHNSFDFCSTTDSAIITGDTGSNVSDLILAIKEE